ncbi:membrane hypothetical protein [Candidatus Sulfopaludibacter sp. SbA3]|nr:membrane hypothetical protein [Candidatus Sulfopaludibacter sp. SbA3]
MTHSEPIPKLETVTLAGVFVFLVMALIIKAVFHLQIAAGQSLGFETPSLFWICRVLAVTYLPTALIHEFGHYLAGRACKQYCRRFVIGPIEFAHIGSRWNVRWIPMRYAGLVDLVPSTFRGFRWQRAWCASGGPMASLCAALALTWLSLRTQSPTVFWTLSFAAQWSLVGLMNLAPIRLGGSTSDGLKLWEAIRGGAALDWTQRDLLTPSSHATPLRLRDWPGDLVLRLANAPAHPVLRRYNCYLAYIHFLDCGDVAMAGQYLDKMTLDWAAGDPPEYALEAAYFHAFHRHDAATAAKWLALEPKDAEPWVRMRARAAIETVSDHPETAQMLIAGALELLNASPACGAHQYEIDRVGQTIAVCRLSIS